MTEVAPAVAEAADGPSDAVLIQAVRGGDIAAYGRLYDRHLVAAKRVAAAIASDEAERDDLIAEGFFRVLRILRSGEGPNEELRPYLLTTIRNTMISWRRRDSALSLVAEVPDVLPGEGSDEPVGSRMHATVAADAFASLPERWKTVLWRTEIEGESPARIAQDLGMTPNGVAALAYRAREGLRQAYLDQHVPAARRRTCRIVSGQLARWVRDGVGDHKAHRITTHLDRCPDCRKLATGLKELNEELPATLAPLILGVPVVTHWLTGSLASSGAATSTGASVLSWATAAKVAAASAAIVTTVTIGASSSDIAPPTAPGAEGTTVQPVSSRPGTRAPAAGQEEPSGSAAGLTSDAPAPSSDAAGAAAQPTATGENAATATNDKQAAKESSKAAKESSKEAAKESRQAAKESKKAEKTQQPTG
ncbi:sigma-70 family RNA polymerase sigma factor [Amycolatopsis sp. NPDC004378]